MNYHGVSRKFGNVGHGIKAYLSIAAHACERFAQCSNTIYSMTDIDKWLENAVQPSCSGFEKENLHPDSRLWQLYSNPHIVCPMLSSLQISGRLSSVKTVALKRENTQIICNLSKRDKTLNLTQRLTIELLNEYRNWLKKWDMQV